MINYRKHFPVNWVDGMKINKTHFIATQDSLSDQIKDTYGINLHENNFGLIPGSFSSSSEPLVISITPNSSNSIGVSLNECRALTIGGARIDISKTYGNSIEEDIIVPQSSTQPNEEKGFFLVIKADIFSKIPFGEANPEENPPRQPYSMPQYTLSLISDDQIGQNGLGSYFLPIGKIKVVEGNISVVNYTPPCMSISSHPNLKNIYSLVNEKLLSLETNFSKIIDIIKRQELQNIRNSLANTVYMLSETMLRLLSTQIPPFKFKAKQETPIQMLIVVAQFARTMKNIIDIQLREHREEFMNYIFKWCNLKQGAFDYSLDYINSLQYSHLNINNSLNSIKEFMNSMDKIFSKLSTLEFIGKDVEEIVIDHRDVEVTAPSPSSSTSEPMQPKKQYFNVLDDIDED